MPNKLVNEPIDERILRLLGLEDVFDLDYQTYELLLKEVTIKRSFGKNKLSQEELALLSNERKRIRGKKGRFGVKEKITADKVATSKFFRSSRALASSIKNISKPSISSGIVGNLGKDLTDISDQLSIVIKNLTDQNKLEKKAVEERRKNKEEEKRRRKEERLESGLKAIKSVVQKVLSPVQGILDKIVRFILFTVLGRGFKMFMDWAADPKNKKKLESVGRFLKDWWPALLGAWFFFANPLGRFIRTVVGSVLKLTFKVARFGIPKLLSFIRTNPLIAAGAVAGVAAGTGYLMEKGRRDELIAKEALKEGKTPQQKSQEIEKGKSWFDRFGEAFQSGQLGMGGVSPLGLSRGGSIFSGIVDKNTGISVSGAGPDTQFLPVADGGGAVLQKGEAVLQVGARERMIEQTGHDPLAFNVGSNANRPRTVRNGLLARSFGGLIGAFNNGGEIGIAAHHLKQDEALSSLTPGINDFTRPGGSKWNKVTTNTPIHSYIDSVGKATIGWGSTFYDSILNGKNPVKGGDKISKGKADDILSTNISNLSREYSTKIPHWNKMSQKQKAGLLILGYNAPYGPLGAYPRLTKALQMGDIRTAAQNLQRGGPNPRRIALERNLLMNGPLNLKNLVGPKIMGEKKVGSGIPFVPPFMHNQMQKRQKGGVIGEGEGSDYGPDGNRLEGADRQFFSYFAQPGEARYIFTKTATQRGAAELAELIQARLDPTSRAGMSGKYNLSPPTRKGRGGIQVLPPIDGSSTSSVANPAAAPSTVVPSFSVVSSAALENRMKIAKEHGIV